MNFSSQNCKFCSAKTESDYVAWRNELGSQGFRTISLSLAHLIANAPPVYTAIMIKPPTPFVGRSFPSLTKAQLEAKIAELAAESPSLHPYIVSASGSGNGTVYAAAFRALSQKTELQTSLTEAEYTTETGKRRENGEIPIWIDSFGTAKSRRFCVIWAKNVDLVSWNAEALNDKGSVRQQRFDAIASVGGRPSLLAITSDGGYARLFVDNKIKGGWKSRPAKSIKAFEAEAAELAKDGFFPVHLASGLIGSSFEIAAIYAQSDEILARSFRKSGIDPSGMTAANFQKLKEIDDWMETYLVSNNIRGGAIALVKGTRLVFARGYSWAEMDAQDIQPTTLFRLASVSKSYCAIAAWRALLDSSAFNRDSKMQAILNLKQRNGQPPKDPDFGKITVRNLLENNSGINQFLFRKIMAELRDSSESPKPQQPVPIAHLLNRVAERNMDNDPGEALAYGKTDYVLLGEIARSLHGAANFDAALKALVLDPLKMTRTRTSRSRIEDRTNDEALHQAKGLPTSPSAVHNDRRIVPNQYGGENYEVFDGAGGISSAVVDLARLCAMFSCRTNNPVLPAGVLRKLFEEAVASEVSQGGHAHHGFDNASGADPSFSISKGGGLPGVGSGFKGKTGDYFAIIFRNGDLQPLGIEEWKEPLRDFAKSINWGTADLFPHYGMPTLLP